MALPRMNIKKFLQTADYKQRYVAACRKLKDDGIYQIFVDWHNDGNVVVVAHNNVCFLAWHRVFIRLFEIQLQNADLALQQAATPGFDANGVISLPWWSWNEMNSANGADSSGAIWKDDFIGGNGESANAFMLGTSSPFGRNQQWPLFTRDENNTTLPTPGHTPNSPPDFTPYLSRNLNRSGVPLPSDKDLAALVNKKDIFDDGFFSTVINPPNIPDPSNSTTASFRAALEGFVNVGGKKTTETFMHNGAHVWVDGTMGRPEVSPNDPAFWLHHCMVDRVWAMWQLRFATNAAIQYPTDTAIAAAVAAGNPSARRRDEAMEPWTGNRTWTGYNGTIAAGNLTTEAYRVENVLNWTNMGANLGSYQYDGLDNSRITI